MKNFLKNAAPLLLLMLFVYAALSKLFTLEEFRGQLHNQSFPGWMADTLLYTLIPLELLTAGLLCFGPTQQWGLRLAALLLGLFTGYIVLVLLHFWDRVPCSCGGILANMTWGVHLAFNIVFLLISLGGLLSLRNSSALRNRT